MSRLATTQTPSKELTPVKAQLKALESSGALGRALPTGISAQRFARIILTEISKNPDLERCQPQTVLGAVMTAAQLGLEFGPVGHAYLVPYKGKATLIVGYKGYIDLARRSGKLQSIIARPVHANDEFDFEYGTTEHLTHRPALTNRGPVIAYYGVALLADGGQVIHVMSPEDVNAFRDRSAASGSGPRTTDYDAMACKTVIRRMAPWLPMSVEAAQAIESDEAVVNWDGVEAAPEITPQEPAGATEGAGTVHEGEVVSSDQDAPQERRSAADWKALAESRGLTLDDVAHVAKDAIDMNGASWAKLGRLEPESAERIVAALPDKGAQ